MIIEVDKGLQKPSGHTGAVCPISLERTKLKRLPVSKGCAIIDKS